MFALVDCNNFYASCERVFQPKLRNKPIVVLSNNDGCVIARSNEAKSINGFFKLQLTNLLLLLIVFQGFRNTKRHFKYY